MPDTVVAVQVQVQVRFGWVKALKRQQGIRIHPKKAFKNTQESQVIQSSRIQSSEF